jgi:hypothetical protein
MKLQGESRYFEKKGGVVQVFRNYGGNSRHFQSSGGVLQSFAVELIKYFFNLTFDSPL